MRERPREVTELHTRLQKAALEVEPAREYWLRTDGREPVSARQAFEQSWFGSRSLARIEELLANLRARFDAFPPSLQVLHLWSGMSPDTRRLVCHWHLQLSDPLYRAFTGDFLPERRESIRPEVTRDVVMRWVTEREAGRWAVSTRLKFASKLLSSAYSAGLLSSSQGDRRILTPRVNDSALGYLLYLLRGTEFEGSLLANPYLRSVGLEGQHLEDRLRRLPGLRFRRQGDLVEFGWAYDGLLCWAEGTIGDGGARSLSPGGGQ